MHEYVLKLGGICADVGILPFYHTALTQTSIAYERLPGDQGVKEKEPREQSSTRTKPISGRRTRLLHRPTSISSKQGIPQVYSVCDGGRYGFLSPRCNVYIDVQHRV